jgi:hypothetical protein
LAIIGASTPNLVPLILIGLALLVLIRVRRIGYLLWVGLPLVAIFGPTALYYLVGLKQPLALFADPGLALPSESVPFLPLSGLVVAAGLAMVALVALLRKRIGLAFSGWAFALLSLASAYLVSALKFPAVGVGQAALETVNGSPSALLIVAGLTLAILAAVAIDGIPARNARRVIASVAVVLAVLPGIAVSFLSAPAVHFSDGRVVPSIVAAEAEQGSQVELLVLTPSTDSAGHKRLAAELVAGDGVHLDDVSLAYRFSISKLADAKYSKIAQLEHLGYVLVPNGSAAELTDLAIALDSVSELETVGATDFGRLWRVRDPKQPATLEQSSPWSITKGVQVAILIGFALMALPSRTTRRRGSEEIFIEAGEDAQ